QFLCLNILLLLPFALNTNCSVESWKISDISFEWASNHLEVSIVVVERLTASGELVHRELIVARLCHFCVRYIVSVHACHILGGCEFERGSARFPLLIRLIVI
ncbi:hypothetical protein PENTCL1PPCAC_3439, partial [Pristionchus entomophagus]